MKQTSKLLLAMLFAVISSSVYSQISGTVFRDYNGNGIKDNTVSFNESFVSGITVTAYNEAGTAVATTTTSGIIAPNYSLSVAAGKYRIEFSGLATGEYSAKTGTGNATSIQFITAPNATVSYAISSPEEYWNNVTDPNPTLLLVAERRGTLSGYQTAGGTVLQTDNSLTGPYSPASNTVAATGTIISATTHAATGSLFGLALQKKRQRFFASASLRRAVEIGPQGPGGVYILEKSPTNYALTGSFTLEGVTPSNSVTALSFGTVTRVTTPNTADNYLTNASGTPTHDIDAFGKAGTMSFGDIESDPNGDKIYMINLFQKRLIVFNATAATATLNNATAATLKPFTEAYDITSLPGCPSPTGAGNNIRPYAVKIYKGKGYLGVVSDAMGTQLKADLKGYILQFDPANITAGFTTVVSINFNTYSGTPFHPWASTWAQAGGTSTSGNRDYQTPIISGIEFNEDGSMDIAIKDRWGDQGGNFEYNPVSGSTSTTQCSVDGDLLHACYVGSAWILEGTAGSCTQLLSNGGGAANIVGSGYSYGATGKEWYSDRSGDGGAENDLGGVTKLFGSGNIMSTIYDPLGNAETNSSSYWNTMGIQWSNVTTGIKSQIARVLNGTNNSLSKSNALGDIEVLTSPQPIEIGNRIWKDTDGNGLQGATETTAGVPTGTTVTLRSPGINGTYGDGDDQIWTTTTDASGNYYFSALSSADNRKPASWTAIGSTVLPGYDYRIEVAVPSGFVLTTTDVGSNASDKIDNDASLNGAGTIALVSFNTANTTHDFDIGFRLGSIGDKVWLDTDKDGTQDAGEVGVSGVTVALYNASNNLIATTKTDATGNYLFSNLPVSFAGVNYQVKFELTAQYQFTQQNGAITVTDNSDANITTGRTSNITLTDVTPDVTYADAGLIPTLPARIGDFIWYDADGDGVQDTGEQGIAGVTVTLYDNAGNPVNSTITGNNGYYSFDDVLPGTYTLGITPPVSYTITTKDQGGDDTKDSDFDPTTFKNAPFVITSGTNNLTFDGGLIKQSTSLASIGDKVWYDIDADGLQDADETGVPAVTVQLYTASNILISTMVTDVFGNYIFNGVTPGAYYIKFTNLSSGYTLTTANTGANDNIDSDVDGTNGVATTKKYTLVAGQSNMTVDAGILSPSSTYSIGDKVWYDLDKDGIQDAPATSGENGVPGVLVILYGSTGLPIDSATTNANGNYLFTGLAAGSYSLGFTALPKGYGFTSINADAAGIAGAANSDVNPYTGITNTITINAGNPNPRYVDAGIIASPVQSQDTKASLGDKVWNDINNNGLQDTGEPGVAGIVITLYAANATTVLATDTTDALGNYLFTNLDGGNYVVGFGTLPAGYTLIAQNTGSDDTKDSDPATATGKTPAILLQPGQANLTVDAGIHATAKSTLGDKVWYDTDADGIQDATEPGVPGVSVTLLDGTGTFIKSTVTDNTGNYLFTDLNAGSYIIGFSNLPAGFTPTTKDATGFTIANGSDADTITLLTGTITLAATTTDLNWDMGIVAANLGAIGDYVWYDADGDGIQDATELPASGILVTLYDNTSTAIGTAITDGAGFYFFPNLPVSAGGVNYTVGFSNLPTNATFTTKGAGTATNNSDVNIATGKTDVIALTTANPVRTDIDAGIVSNFAAVGNYVWYDVNNNGLQGATEVGVPGDLVTLYNTGANAAIGGGDDFIVSSAITDGTGGYFINNIPVTACTNFYMQFGTVPGGTAFTTRNIDAAGINGPNNSDANASGQTLIFSLCPEQINSNIDAGIFPPSGIILPIQKLDISANLIGNIAIVHWNTENEINAAKFIVERSIDNLNFTYVGEKAGRGNFTGTTRYQLNDDLAAINTNIVYYRIKAVDINGKVAYSKIVTIRISRTSEIKAWPNPFTNSISISLQSRADMNVQVTLLDDAGRSVKSNAYTIATGNNQINIDDLKVLAKGVYTLKVTDAAAKTILTKKFLKN